MRSFTFTLAVVAISCFCWAQNNTSSSNNSNSDIAQELSKATNIVQEMTGPSSTAGIPDSVLQNAKCVAVVPNLIQAGFIVGGRHGSGIATCRTSGNQWTPPAPFKLTGASWGAQIGGQSIDLVMMVMNDKGMQALRNGHFKLGGEVSGAAGPVGRQASASGGWKAGILTYSRTKGAYAGATIKGAELQQDDDATKALYGNDVKFGQILNGQVSMPSNTQAHDFVNAVEHAEQTAMAH
jgi:lipid-binding SYLF domain-containing protein